MRMATRVLPLILLALVFEQSAVARLRECPYQARLVALQALKDPQYDSTVVVLQTLITQPMGKKGLSSSWGCKEGGCFAYAPRLYDALIKKPGKFKFHLVAAGDNGKDPLPPASTPGRWQGHVFIVASEKPLGDENELIVCPTYQQFFPLAGDGDIPTDVFVGTRADLLNIFYHYRQYMSPEDRKHPADLIEAAYGHRIRKEVGTRYNPKRAEE